MARLRGGEVSAGMPARGGSGWALLLSPGQLSVMWAVGRAPAMHWARARPYLDSSRPVP